MAENFCSNCGKPLLQDDKFCSACGESTVRTETSLSTAPAPPYYDSRPDYKDPFTAALGSLLFVCVGQFYVGKWWRGLGFLALAIFLFWLTLPISGIGVVVIWVIAPIDAYDQARKHNLKYGYSEGAKEATGGARGYLIDKAGIFGGIFFIIGLISLGVVLTEGLAGLIWLFIPTLFIVLGVGSIYVNLTKFRYET
jgi:zinc-ribbon domain